MSCGCDSGPIRVPTTPLSTRSTTQVFFPLTGPQPAGNVLRIIGRVFIDSHMGSYDADFGYQVSDDLETWTNLAGTPDAFNTFGPGWDQTYDNSFEGADTAVTIDRLFVRMGVAINRNSGDANTVAVTVTPTFQFQNF